MSEDFRKPFEDFRKWFEEYSKGDTIKTANLEQFNKQISQFNAQAQASWEQLLKLIHTSYIDSSQKVIVTNAHEGPNYKTIIKLNGDLKNEFPSPSPDTNDVYWLRHNQLVDEAVALQKEMIMKVIDTVGTTIQKVVNPISISTTDLVNIMGLFRR